MQPSPRSIVRPASFGVELLFVTVLLIFGACPVRSVQPGAGETRAEFEQLASEMPYLDMNAVLYDRTSDFFHVAHPKTSEDHFRILRRIADSTQPKAALCDLLTHPDPKVRTLAAVALFEREDATVLPALVGLCDDKTATFDGYADLDPGWMMTTGVGPGGKRQTVGSVTALMVNFYLERAGFGYGVKYRDHPGFAEYWAARKDRTFCASWFAVQLERAREGTFPIRLERLGRVRALRERIDRLPPDDRAWTLLRLRGESNPREPSERPDMDAPTTDDELVAAARQLGPDRLLGMLGNRVASDDPDMQPHGEGDWKFSLMQDFVLQHAAALLRPADADVLLTLETWQRSQKRSGKAVSNVTARYAVAAADLRPADAGPILHSALDRFVETSGSDRADVLEQRELLCIALWQKCGDPEKQFVVDWFYRVMPPFAMNPGCRSDFIERVGAERNGREMIAAIINDLRLIQIDWASLEQLVRVVNHWCDKPVVTEDEMREAWHPFGEGRYDEQPEEAERQYPKETAALRAHLKEWRERLQASVPAWTAPSAAH